MQSDYMPRRDYVRLCVCEQCMTRIVRVAQ